MSQPFLPVLTTALGLCLALPAHAFDIATMDTAQRDAFRAEIRAYLLENPEVIMEAVAVLEQRDQQQQAQLDTDLLTTNSAELFDDGHSWVGGNPEGDITLVEFMDYRCGYCRRAFDEIETLVETDGNIRFILKEFPILGAESDLAARFAIATQMVAGDAAYKDIHDALMTFTGQINETSLRRLGDSLGLESQTILDQMTDDRVTEVISRNRDLAGRLRISGTPTFVMNDRMLRGYLPLDGMMEVAEQIRSQ